MDFPFLSIDISWIFAHLCDEEIRCATFIFNDILQTDQKNLVQIQTLILYNIQFLPKPWLAFFVYSNP